MNINILPSELLLMIFKKLLITDLKSVMLVCKYWRSMGGDPILWKKFPVLIENPHQFTQVLSIPRLSCLEHITIDGLYEFNARYENFHVDFLLERGGVKILEIGETADLRNVFPEKLAKLVNKCEIVELGYNLTKRQMREIFSEMSSSVTNLKKLWLPDDVHHVPADMLAEGLVKIPHITLSNITQKQVMAFFTAMTKDYARTIFLNTHTADLAHLPSSVISEAAAKLQGLRASLSAGQVSSIMKMLSSTITTTMTSLHLGQSDLTMVDPGVLARGLVRVEEVEMMWTRLDTCHIVELVKEMSKDYCVLKHLQLNHDLTEVPADILAIAINKLETAGILACNITQEQTDKIFIKMSTETNLKKINHNNLSSPLTMSGIARVDKDTLAKGVNKLVEVLLHVGDYEDEISGDQLLAIIEESCVTTNLRQVTIHSGGTPIPGYMVELATKNISKFYVK